MSVAGLILKTGVKCFRLLVAHTKNQLLIPPNPPFSPKGRKNLCEAKWGMHVVMEYIASNLMRSSGFPTLKKGG